MQFTVAIPMLDPSHYLPLARTAEAVGFSSVAVPESVFYPETVSAKYPYTEDGSRFWPAETPFLDPFVAIPAMAAVTERIRFYTNVLKLGIREPLLVAKAVSSAASLSGGRVGLGVGLSWIPEEFTWLGQEMRSRGARADEAIEIIRLACSGEFVEYHGAHYDFNRLMMRPAAPGQVPIYVGGHSPAGLRRAARLGDGWISVVSTTEELAVVIDKLAVLRREMERDHLPFEIKAISMDALEVDGFRRLAEVGVTDAIVCPWYFYGGDIEDLEVQQESLERFAAEVISVL
ncbi:MAG: TIGR03619 family F420-dependent LLM class oxidoreductase [Microthrixaceae bacterium]|nr:TIGR03619 family F420-dependent LLM class oxidoreductase [Microthrixaceae bacterium]